jgi:hypothetical protein
MGRLFTASGSGCCSLILVDALFLLDGGGRGEGKKEEERETATGEEGFLGSDLH